VIGIVQVGQQALADRYMYLPAIGLFVMLTWGLSELNQFLSHQAPVAEEPKPQKARPAAADLKQGTAGVARPTSLSPAPAMTALALLALAICGFQTFAQSGYWKNTTTLFTHALAVTQNNAVAHNNLGAVLVDAGDIPAAEQHFTEAVRIQPRNGDALANLAVCRDKQGRTPEAMELFARAIEAQPTAVAHYNFANALAKQKRFAEAETHYQAALEKRPEFVECWHNLGNMKTAEGKRGEAESCYRAALRLRPGYIEARLNLGILLVGQQKLDEAIAEFKTAVQVAPNNPDAHFDLASAWNTKGDFAQAAAEFAEAVRLRPNDLENRANLAQALMNQGKVAEATQQFEEILRLNPTPQAHYGVALALDGRGQAKAAIAHYREAIRLDTNNPAYPNDLAWLLATCPKPDIRDGAEAVRLAEQACRLSGGKEPRFWGTLDAAYAEAGRFDDAAATAMKTRDLALAAGQKDVAQAAEERLALYRAKRAYRTAQLNEK
jgi:tetratricopeptide (TPR) repeat protein